MKSPRTFHWLQEDPLDLNYLLYRQQVERSLADRATPIEARQAHEELASRYEKQIEQLTGPDFVFIRTTDRSSDRKNGTTEVVRFPPEAGIRTSQSGDPF